MSPAGRDWGEALPEGECRGRRLCGGYGGSSLAVGPSLEPCPEEECLPWRRRAVRVWEVARLREGELALERQKQH